MRNDYKQLKRLSEKVNLTLKIAEKMKITQETKLRVYELLDELNLDPASTLRKLTNGENTKVMNLTNLKGKEIIEELKARL